MNNCLNLEAFLIGPLQHPYESVTHDERVGLAV